MFFILLLGLGALSLASVSAYFSIWGLAHTFPAVFWGVIAMGIVIEYGKLIGISFMYRYWSKVSSTLKRYMFPPLVGITLLVMAITAAGHYGYLSSGYQADILPLKQITEQIKTLEGEKARKIDRKLEIDKQIAQLPSDFVRGRVKLMKQFHEEQQEVTARVNELDNQILSLKTESLKTETHVGPIIYLAKALGIDADRATNYLVLMIICVFDPLALLLTIATNVAIRQRELEVKEVPVVGVSEPFPNYTFIEPTVAEEPAIESPLPEPEPVIEPESIIEEPIPEFVPEPGPSDTGVRPNPPSIVELRKQLTELNSRESLSEADQFLKSRIEEQLRHYEAQNYVFTRGSALDR
jgi:hypothetical protein